MSDRKRRRGPAPVTREDLDFTVFLFTASPAEVAREAFVAPPALVRQRRYDRETAGALRLIHHLDPEEGHPTE